MGNYFYRAKDNNDKIISKYIRAKNLNEAANKIAAKGLILLELREEEIKSLDLNAPPKNIEIISMKTVFSLREKRDFFTSMYNLYSSGMSILEMFKTMMNSSKNPKIKGLCYQILRKTEKGASLKESMTRYSGVLGKAYTMLLFAGETSGQLDDILPNIIKNISKQEQIKKDLISILTYPAIVILLIMTSEMIYEFFILPVFQNLYTIQEQGYGPLAFSAAMKIIVVYAIMGGCLFFLYTNKWFIKKLIDFLAKLKFFANITYNYAFSNFFTVMSLAYSAGVSLSDSIALANSVVDIEKINNKIIKAQIMVENGCQLTTAFSLTQVFSDYAISQIGTGEQAGELESVLKSIAVDYEQKLDTTISVIKKSIGPIILVILAIIVGYLASRMYADLFNGIAGIG